MNKANTFDHPKRATPNPREREALTTLTLKMLTPPPPQRRVMFVADTLHPLETSDRDLYVKIIGDAMAKFSPTEKMSKILAWLADKFKEKEGTSTPIPVKPTVDFITPRETAEELISEKSHQETTTPHSGNSVALIPSPEREENMRIKEQGDHQEEGCGAKGSDKAEIPEKEVVLMPTKGRTAEGRSEVIMLEEDESGDEEESLSQRAARKDLRKQRKWGKSVPTGRLGEHTELTAAKLEEAEQRRKGKHIVTPSKEVKRLSTSQGIVIQEPTESLNKPLHLLDDEREADVMDTSEGEGVYEKKKVTIDHKLLKAMVHFKDSIMKELAAEACFDQ